MVSYGVDLSTATSVLFPNLFFLPLNMEERIVASEQRTVASYKCEYEYTSAPIVVAFLYTKYYICCTLRCCLVTTDTHLMLEMRQQRIPTTIDERTQSDIRKYSPAGIPNQNRTPIFCPLPVCPELELHPRRARSSTPARSKEGR